MVDETQAADQASEQSAMERLTAKIGRLTGLGDERPAEADETSAEQPSQSADFAEIEWNGGKYQIPSALKDAFMQQADYTKKTQELAEQRRVYDQAREVAQTARMEQAFAESIKGESQELGLIDAYLKQIATIDWSALTTDQMLKQKIEIDNIKDRKTALNQSIQEKRSAFQNDLRGKLADLRAKAREIAAKKIGEFNEETEKAIRAHAASKGLTEAEIDNVLVDPRSAEIIWEAAQFHKVKAGATKASEAVAKNQKVLKPGAAGERMPADTAARLNFGKAMKGARTSGEKAAVIEQRLAGVFAKHN